LKHVQNVIHSTQVTKNSKFQAVELKDLNKNMVLKTNFWKNQAGLNTCLLYICKNP